MTPELCSDVTNLVEVQSSVNVTHEFKGICGWILPITLILQFGIFFILNDVSIDIGGLLTCIGVVGFTAWFIAANIFTYREEGRACSYLDHFAEDGSVGKSWQNMWQFMRRSIVAWYCFIFFGLVMICALGAMKVHKKRYNNDLNSI